MKQNYLAPLFLIVISFLMTSCSINGSFQGLYSYYKISEKSRPDLFVPSSAVPSICNITVDSTTPKVYIINGEMLKQCIVKKDKVLVYFWSPKCSSPVCISPDLLQQLCDRNDFELYIVAEYYDIPLMDVPYSIQNPIFGIDTEYYGSNLTKNYLQGFVKDLTSRDQKTFRFYYFNQGNLKDSYHSVEDVIQFHGRN